MAGSINKVILVGQVGKDPEIKQFQNGDRIANLTLATNEHWKDKATGERKQKTEWHRIVIQNPHLIDVAEKWLTKGTTVFIEGSLQTRKWQDQSGQDKYATEIVLPKFGGILTLLGSGSGKSEGHAEPSRQDDFDDEIPF